jgi:hypothetical protein
MTLLQTINVAGFFVTTVFVICWLAGAKLDQLRDKIDEIRTIITQIKGS